MADRFAMDPRLLAKIPTLDSIDTVKFRSWSFKLRNVLARVDARIPSWLTISEGHPTPIVQEGDDAGEAKQDGLVRHDTDDGRND